MHNGLQARKHKIYYQSNGDILQWKLSRLISQSSLVIVRSITRFANVSSTAHVIRGDNRRQLFYSTYSSGLLAPHETNVLPPVHALNQLPLNELNQIVHRSLN
jgi:hypothetical protein